MEMSKKSKNSKAGDTVDSNIGNIRMKEIMESIGIKEIKEMYKLKEAGKCPFCSSDVNINDFKDKLSKEEFKLSGLCQDCQDEFFGTDM